MNIFTLTNNLGKDMGCYINHEEIESAKKHKATCLKNKKKRKSKRK